MGGRSIANLSAKLAGIALIRWMLKIITYCVVGIG